MAMVKTLLEAKEISARAPYREGPSHAPDGEGSSSITDEIPARALPQTNGHSRARPKRHKPSETPNHHDL
jgi:hypothetical protein